MKKLFTIAGIFLSLAFGTAITIADELPIIFQPEQQYAIEGSILNFDISTSGAVTQDSRIKITLPSDLKFLSATVPPRNLLQVQLGEQPYRIINSGDVFHVQLTAKEMSQEFSELVVEARLIEGDSGLATGSVNPIGDIQVEKTMTSSNPKEPGDVVSYDIKIKNIGSATTENAKIVDVRPNNILTFSNYGTLNGTQIVPYIYNGNLNQFEFTIGDIAPGDESILTVEGTLNTGFSVGTQFANTAFALIDAQQYSTGNDNSTTTGTISGYPNLYVSGQKMSSDPSNNGDSMVFTVSFGNNGQEVVENANLIVYIPEIMNQNNVSVSMAGGTQQGNMISWDLSGLAVGYQNTITISGEMMTASPVGTEYSLTARIYTEQQELTGADNNFILTGKIQSYFVGELSPTVQNLTRPNMNISDVRTQAISGDETQIRITLTNNGNIIQEGLLRVTNGSEVWFSQQVSLIPGKSSVFTVNKVVGPKNYQSITPEIKFSYGDNLSIVKSVQIDEPLQCGDGFITQNEACDTASQEGLLPGQHCSNNCMSIITDSIVNTACIEYNSEWGNGQICDDVTIYVGEEDYMCSSITSAGNVVQIDDDGRGSMRFTCETSDGITADSIVIYCGNGQTGTKHNAREFSYTCNYIYDDDEGANDYTVSCVVNNQIPTNPSCEKDIMVGYGFYGNCGNGIIEPGEDCDLWNTSTYIWRPKTIGYYLDYFGTVEAGSQFANKGYTCKNCKILSGGNFVYEPAECLQTDTPISVMDKEIFPFWWRLWIKDTQRTSNDNACANYNGEKTLLKESSMYCNFAVYNGRTYTQGNDSNPAFQFRTKCFNNNFNELEIYDYFKGTHQTKADGASSATINTLLGGLNNILEFGEYKLVLEEVEYDYCNTTTHDWAKGQRYGAVCEVNFAVTKPYTMQISTLGANPIATNGEEFLHDFWDMDGNKLLKRTDLSSVINTDDSSYEVTSNAQSKINEFKEKYEKLAIAIDRTFKVNGKTIGEMFGQNVTVMKVPNKHIYFIKGNGGTLTLSQDKIGLTSSYTVFVDGMDVEIEGNVLQYAMIITTEKMKFKDKGEGTEARCATGGQVVQGIFVALKGFEAGERLKNTSVDEQRCAWGGLHVKGVLIGDGLEDLMESRRSQLNQWFTSNPGQSTIEKTRRNLIIGGAAVLIEYNPSLWKTLPPGAEIFTESLEVYRK